MGVYNIPVTWTRVGHSYDNNKVKKYDGIINLNIPSGNNIVGTWGVINGSGTIYQDESTQYWNVLELKAYLTQGLTVSSSYYDGGDGPFYPNRSYGFKFDMGFNLAGSSNYSISIEPYHNQFANLSLPSTLPLNITELEAEKPFNFTKTGTSIYEDIIINFNLLSSNTVDYEIMQNEAQVLSGLNVNTRKIIIPKGTLKNNNSVSVKVRSKFEFQGTMVYSDWVTYGISGLAGFNAPEIENLRYVGAIKVIEEPMLIAWENIDTVNGSTVIPTIELWQDGYLIYNKAFAGTQIVIPSSTIKSTNTVTVKIYNTATYLSYTAKSKVKELTLNGLTSIKPVVTDFTLDGLNRDYDITIIPTCEGADKYRVNGRDGLTIPKGTLANGANKITLEAIKVTSDNREIIGTHSKFYILTQDMPQIYSLEPSGINVNISQDVPVTFVVNENFIDSFRITYANQVVTGTNARKHIVAPNIFNKSNNTISLEVTYTPKYTGATTRTVTKTVTFYGFGKPTKPTITESTVYKSPLPTIKWNTNRSIDSEAQTGYRILIKQDGRTIESIEKQSTLSEHTLKTELTNNTKYQIELNVQNKYFLWSDTLTHEIETNFNELPIVNFDLFENGASVLVKTSLESTIPADFEQLKVYRRENKDWILLADKLLTSDIVVDSSVRTMIPVEYKVRLYDKYGAFSESDTKTITLNKSSFVFSVPPKLENPFEVKSITSTISFASDKKYKLFAKRKVPKVYVGTTNYAILQLTVTLEKTRVQDFINLLENEVLLYRDIRGNKYYVNGTVESKKPINFLLDELNVTLTETEYDETLMFAAESLRTVALLDGQSFLNGTRYLRGQSTW